MASKTRKKRKATTKVRTGDIVAIRFYDHVESDSDSDVLEFWAYGHVVHVDETCIKIHSWHFVDPVQEAGTGKASNVKGFSIVRGAVLEVKRLGRQSAD